MQKRLLNKIIKANLNEKKSLNELVEEFIQTQTNLAKGQLEDFLSSLFIYINRNYDKVPKDELLNILESKLQDLNIQFDTKDIVFEVVETQNVKDKEHLKKILYYYR